MATKEQYVVNENGERTAVLLDVEYYRELLAALEEIDQSEHTTKPKPNRMKSFPSRLQ